MRSDYYNIAIAQMAMTTLVSGVWALDPVEDLADRIASDFTLVLASVAMKFVVAQTLPPVSYVTLLERYINFTFFFLGLGERSALAAAAAVLLKTDVLLLTPAAVTQPRPCTQ